MSDKNMIAEAAGKIFKDFLTPALRSEVYAGKWPGLLWDKLGETGLLLAARPEASGGAGLGIAECCAVARACGQHAVPLPLIESYIADQVLAAAGIAPVDGITGIALPVRGNTLGLRRTDTGLRVSGTLRQVPWGRFLAQVVAIADDGGKPATVLLTGPFNPAPHSENAAAEPRDTLVFDDAPVAAAGATGQGFSTQSLHATGALYRSAQMIGAMLSALELAVTHVKQREQFGRPIAKFQAVQQQIAQMASEIVASDGVVAAAIEAAGMGPGSFAIAAAKSRLGKAVDMTVDVAHQVHGAIGTTRDYPLHLYTMRLSSWRDECGSPGEWSEWIGRLACRTGGAQLWPQLTAGFPQASA